jgi:hypothetical protein
VVAAVAGVLSPEILTAVTPTVMGEPGGKNAASSGGIVAENEVVVEGIGVGFS